MKLEEMTVGEVLKIRELFSAQKQVQKENVVGPWEIGENYLVRTVTMILTGKLKAVYCNELVLSDADWIADTGRFSQALEDSDKFSEVEPFKNDAIIGRGSIVDATKIIKLFRKLK